MEVCVKTNSFRGNIFIDRKKKKKIVRSKRKYFRWNNPHVRYRAVFLNRPIPFLL